MIDLLLLNTFLQLIWYASVGCFVLYKYTSLFLQARNVVKFAIKAVSSIGYLTTKTWYFISGTQPIKLEDSNEESRLKKWWRKTKEWFGFTKSINRDVQNINLTSVSSQDFSQSDSLSTSQQNNIRADEIFYKKYNDLLNDTQGESQLITNESRFLNQSFTDKYAPQDSTFSDSEPITIAASQHDYPPHSPDNREYYDTYQDPLDTMYSIDLGSKHI